MKISVGAPAVLTILACLVTLVASDVYMQNPRGSNDRLNEAGQDRNNAQRLFDSENNARGGYCWGPPMQYYTGSELSIEWTSQHGCGSDNVECNVVLQYMCTDDNGDKRIAMRDGSTTQTIQDNDPGFQAQDGAGNYLYGMHESYDYYQMCKARQRNRGLFVADQALTQNTAVATRQNKNGQQHGFECAEERDYYPYWHPSPWKDVAILVDDKDMCDYFQGESQNVKDKNFCNGTTAAQRNPNNERACIEAGGSWTTVKSWGIKKPDCQEAPWQRDNHLGNTQNGFAAQYNWTLPTDEPCLDGKCSCVLRLRYNISTPHTKNWPDVFTDSTSNGPIASPVTNDPNVMVEDQNLTLAVDTAQYGRGFQDRTHIWNLIRRPKGIDKDAKIYNLNVRGKRGNIVQTFPATEYDFVPTQLKTKVGDYVHFQWTGCDTNPNNNAGEGTAGTDRSNIVQIKSYASQYPLTAEELKKDVSSMFDSADLRYRMAHLDQAGCLSYAALLSKNNNNQNNVKQDPQNCMKLNAASAYFDGGLVKMNRTGSFYYMSSRNNNFSNRSQKAHLIVEDPFPKWAVAVIVVGGFAVVSAAAVGGSVFYAKKHPHSKIGELVSRVPGINKI